MKKECSHLRTSQNFSSSYQVNDLKYKGKNTAFTNSLLNKT